MSMEEAHPEAAALLAAAGWAPHDGWNVFTRGTLVMGFQPDGQAFHVKNWAAIAEGHPQWSADTPDTAEEAVAWLVERFKPAPNDLTTEATLDPVAFQSEEVENLQDESNGETGEETQAAEREGPGSTSELLDAGCDGAAFSELEPIDADFTIEDLGGPDETLELPAPDPEDFAPEDFPPEEDLAPSVAIFGPPADHLEALRSQRMGDTMRYANMLMPPWTPDDNARLAYLRNFAMGVSEGRWENNSTMQSELESCESTLSRVNDIKEARDTKVSFLESADRDGVEGFVVEADWP